MWRCRRPGHGKIMPVGDRPLHLLLWDPDLKRCRDKHEDGVKLVAPPVKLTCYKCHKKVPNLDEHILTRGFWRCPRCQLSHLVANKATHTEECTKAFPAWCKHCFRYMSAPDFERHRGACSFQMCPYCRSACVKRKSTYTSKSAGVSYVRFAVMLSILTRRTSVWPGDVRSVFEISTAIRKQGMLRNVLVQKPVVEVYGSSNWTRGWADIEDFAISVSEVSTPAGLQRDHDTVAGTACEHHGG